MMNYFINYSDRVYALNIVVDVYRMSTFVAYACAYLARALHSSHRGLMYFPSFVSLVNLLYLAIEALPFRLPSFLVTPLVSSRFCVSSCPRNLMTHCCRDE